MRLRCECNVICVIQIVRVSQGCNNTFYYILCVWFYVSAAILSWLLHCAYFTVHQGQVREKKNLLTLIFFFFALTKSCYFWLSNVNNFCLSHFDKQSQFDEMLQQFCTKSWIQWVSDHDIAIHCEWIIIS